jgi:hypothetical protein
MLKSLRRPEELLPMKAKVLDYNIKSSVTTSAESSYPTLLDKYPTAFMSDKIAQKVVILSANYLVITKHGNSDVKFYATFATKVHPKNKFSSIQVHWTPEAVEQYGDSCLLRSSS